MSENTGRMFDRFFARLQKENFLPIFTQNDSLELYAFSWYFLMKHFSAKAVAFLSILEFYDTYLAKDEEKVNRLAQVITDTLKPNQ